MDTKRQILVVARTLFNKKGYHQVKMRDISNELGISVGNLTYHFKKKQDLLEAIHQDTYQSLRKNDTIETLSDLVDLLKGMIKTIFYERYSFIDRTINEEMPEFMKKQEERSINVTQNVINAMKNLRQNNVLEADDSTLEVIVQFMLLSHIGWILDIKEMTKEVECDFVKKHLDLLKVYLTEEGLREYYVLMQTYSKPE